MTEAKVKNAYTMTYAGAGAALSAVFVLILFVLVPQWNRLETQNSMVSLLKEHIRQVQNIAGGDDNLGNALDFYRRRLKSIDLKLPDAEGHSLRMLSGEAKKIGLEVISIKPSKMTKSGVESSAGGYVVKALPVTVRLKGDYIKIGEYLKRVRTSYYSLIIIRDIVFNLANDDAEPSLDAYVNAEIYIKAMVDKKE